jgi:hypothetical protein
MPVRKVISAQLSGRSRFSTTDVLAWFRNARDPMTIRQLDYLLLRFPELMPTERCGIARLFTVEQVEALKQRRTEIRRPKKWSRPPMPNRKPPATIA